MRTDFCVKFALVLLALIFVCAARSCAQEFTNIHRWETHQRSRQQPKTFTRTFTAEMSIAGLSLAADGFTTEKHRGNWKELNPVLNNFSHGPKSNAVYFSAMFSGLIYSNHLLRNHPRYRHVLNFSVIGLESFWATRNSLQPRKIVR
jgi:hypothetical protein